MEIWDLIDENGNKTGKTMVKGEPIPKGMYHSGADVWIINSENKIFIQKRSPKKRLSPNVWAMTGGSIIKGETSIQTIERETLEELAIKINVDNLKFVKRFNTDEVFIDTYLCRQDIELNDIVMQENEVSEVKWATFEEIEELFNNGQFIEYRWEFIRDIIKAEITRGE